MNAMTLARAAYGRPGSPTRTSRSVEYDLFARVTHRLNFASAEPEKRFNELAAALHDNRRLWAALASDVASSGNGLPEALRARIFYLSEYTAQHSSKVLAGTARADVLTEINMAVMRGLRGEGAAQ